MHPGGNPKRIVTRAASSIPVVVAVCFTLFCSSITSYAGLTELFERSGSRIAENAAGKAALAFKSLKVAGRNGAYLARTGDQILYLTRTGDLISKWSLRDGVAPAHFIASEAERYPEAIFELLVESDVFLGPGVALQNLPSNVIVGVVSGDGHISETRLAYIHGKMEYLVEGNDSKTLFIDMRHKTARSKFAELQKRSFSKNDVSLLTLVDPKANRATADALERAARENGVRNRIASAEEIESDIRASHRKLLLVVGHTEGPKFVVRAADGSQLYAVDFNRLESFARANDVTVISLGCNTGLGGLLNRSTKSGDRDATKACFGSEKLFRLFQCSWNARISLRFNG